MDLDLFQKKCSDIIGEELKQPKVASALSVAEETGELCKAISVGIR